MLFDANVKYNSNAVIGDRAFLFNVYAILIRKPILIAQ
jgi:hypothetical protein